MFKIKSVLPDVVTDNNKITDRFRSLGIIPYASTSLGSAHGYLDLLRELTVVSPSHGTCINNLYSWAFGGNIGFASAYMPGLMLDQQDNISMLPNDDAISVAELLNDLGISLSELQNIQLAAFKSYKAFGQFWIRCVISKGVEKFKVLLEHIDSRNIAFIAGSDNKSVIVSDNKLNAAELNRAKISRRFPEVIELDDGSIETFFLFGNIADIYGRPDTEHAIIPMIIEARQNNLHANIANTDLAVKFLLFLEEVTPAGDIDDENNNNAAKVVAKQLRKIGGNPEGLSNAENLVAISYPEGAQKPEVAQLTANRDSAYFKMTSEDAKGKIYAAHNWSTVLSGDTVAPAGIGGNIVIDEFRIKNETTVKPLQRKFSMWWGEVFKFIYEKTSMSELSGLVPVWQDRIAGLSENFNTINT